MRALGASAKVGWHNPQTAILDTTTKIGAQVPILGPGKARPAKAWYIPARKGRRGFALTRPEIPPRIALYSEQSMQSEQPIPAISAPPFNIWARLSILCGWLSIACCLPYLAFALGIWRLQLPDSFFAPLLWSLFLSPVVGVILALIASIKTRGWLLFAGAWIAVSIYEFWELYRHPIVI
jgi:hypothetical protein